MTFRIVTSFWKINECIKWHPIPLPRIMDQLQQLESLVSANPFYLSQGFYMITLDEERQKICSTILSWGKHTYKQLPMGVAYAPGMFQAIMTKTLGDLDYVLIYID